MKKAAIIWNIAIAIISILFATKQINDMGWLIYSIATTFICTIIADNNKEEKKEVNNA